jgi:hypothetical protein
MQILSLIYSTLSAVEDELEQRVCLDVLFILRAKLCFCCISLSTHPSHAPLLLESLQYWTRGTWSFGGGEKIPVECYGCNQIHSLPEPADGERMNAEMEFVPLVSYSSRGTSYKPVIPFEKFLRYGLRKWTHSLPTKASQPKDEEEIHWIPWPVLHTERLF